MDVVLLIKKNPPLFCYPGCLYLFSPSFCSIFFNIKMCSPWTLFLYSCYLGCPYLIFFWNPGCPDLIEKAVSCSLQGSSHQLSHFSPRQMIVIKHWCHQQILLINGNSSMSYLAANFDRNHIRKPQPQNKPQGF